MARGRERMIEVKAVNVLEGSKRMLVPDILGFILAMYLIKWQVADKESGMADGTDDERIQVQVLIKA